jgi:folylpolyglutamate synthase/dihydropteroate synthase
MMEQVATGADKIIFTRASTCARGADPKDIAEIYTELSDGRVAQITSDLEEALNVANSAVSREDIIVVTGSFYLVGEAKRLLGKDK